ncbi:MAG TPA: hypothetical protein VGF32_00995 [Streptosporangiaceae bacterium]
MAGDGARRLAGRELGRRGAGAARPRPAHRRRQPRAHPGRPRRAGGDRVAHRRAGLDRRLSLLGEQGAEEVLALLRPSVRAVIASGIIPEVNPTGLRQAG